VNRIFTWLRVLASIVIPLLFSQVLAAQTPQTIFEFVSSPGDYIGQGQTLALTPSDVTFTEYPGYSFEAPGQTVRFSLSNYTQGPPPNGVYIDWTLIFSAPAGQSLAVGSYANANRYPFNTAPAPGINVSGMGRGCNQEFGSFQVLDVAFDPATGTLLRFAADFTDYCESPSAAPITGAIRYNSSIPAPEIIGVGISIPLAVNAKGCYEATSPSGVDVTATGSGSGAANLAYNWSTSTGLTGTDSQFSFSIPFKQSVVLSLTATDPLTGVSKTVTKQVCSSDTTAPQVMILSPQDGASYDKLPALDVSVTDAVDKSVKTVQVVLGETATYQLNDQEQLHTHINARHAVGNQVMTRVIVYATDASGNIGQSSVSILIDKNL
jgi:hypothetical protein